MEIHDDDFLDENARWQLTPKTCLGFALAETEISMDPFLMDERNSKFELVYTILEHRINDAGYITDENGKTKDHTNSDKPEVIFTKTIKGFYPKATDEQISVAWDVFVYHMDRQGDLARKDQIFVP